MTALKGKTSQLKFGCGTLKLSINKEGTELVETFIRLGKNGSCSRTLLEAVSRLIGLALRHSIPAEEIGEELTMLQCYNGVWEDGVYMRSCCDYIGKKLKGEI